jgi:hypothetical protein
MVVFLQLETFDAKGVRYLTDFGEFQSTVSGKKIMNLIEDSAKLGKALHKWGITSAFYSKLDEALAKHGESLRNISKRLFILKKNLNDIANSLKAIHDPDIKTASSNKLLSAIIPPPVGPEIIETSLKEWSHNFSPKGKLFIDGSPASLLEVMRLANQKDCRRTAKEKGFYRRYYVKACRRISIAVNQIMPYLIIGEPESFSFLLKMPFGDSNKHTKFWQRFLFRIGVLNKREASRGYHPKTFIFFLELIDKEDGFKKTRRLMPKLQRTKNWAVKWLKKQKKEDLLHWKP